MNKFADFMTDEEARLELNIPPPHAHGHAPDVSLAEQGLFLPIAGQKQAPSFCWAWACWEQEGLWQIKEGKNCCAVKQPKFAKTLHYSIFIV